MTSTGMLQTLSIADLRSYASLEATFGGGPQLIVGPNAAGKTTLLEAIVLLAWGRSHRTSTDAELVRWGSELARVEGLVVLGDLLDLLRRRPASLEEEQRGDEQAKGDGPQINADKRR